MTGMKMFDYMLSKKTYYAVKIKTSTVLEFDSRGNITPSCDCTSYAGWVITTCTGIIHTPFMHAAKWFGSLEDAKKVADSLNENSCFTAEVKKVSKWRMFWWWMKMIEHDHD